jgi:hypothetical protein
MTLYLLMRRGDEADEDYPAGIYSTLQQAIEASLAFHMDCDICHFELNGLPCVPEWVAAGAALKS